MKKFDSLQVFRGLAALGVVLFHSGNKVNLYIGDVPSWIDSLLLHGFLGVDFFFVLSGFIIMSSHYEDNKSLAALKNYSIKRFVRIFPPYWPVAISLIFAFIILPSMRNEYHGQLSLLSTLLLLPDVNPPAVAVAWTLIHEVMFYMIFVLFFVSNRLFIGFVTTWVLAICATGWLTGETHFSPFIEKLLNPINLEFVFGMAIAYLARGVSNRFATGWVFIGTISFILLLCWPFSSECRVLFGMPFSCLVLGMVMLDRQDKLIFPRWMVMIGDASYSIYLTHNQLLSLTSKWVARLQGFASWWLGMLIGVLSSIFVGILYHLLIEKRLISLFRQLLNRKSVS